MAQFRFAHTIEMTYHLSDGSLEVRVRLDNLIRYAPGRATMWVQGKAERLDVSFGPKYKSVVVYSPGGENRDFIRFDLWAGIADAMNPAHRGIIPPGENWTESFWVKPVGY